MMKGNLTFVAVLMLAVLILIATSISPKFSIFGEDESTFQKISLQSNIYSMSHAIDTARIYSKTALRYSVYQACYDSLKEGSDSGTAEDYYKLLESKTSDHFNKYTSSGYIFLGDFIVDFPDYTLDVTQGSSDTNFMVKAVPNEKFSTSSSATSGEAITLRETAEIVESFNMPCYTLLSRGQGIQAAKLAEFNNVFEAAVETMKASECSDTESCTEILSNNLIKGPVKTEESGLSVTWEVSGILGEVTVTTSGEDTLRTFRSESTFKITIKDADQTTSDYYPVWNGEEVAFERFELSFTDTVKST